MSVPDEDPAGRRTPRAKRAELRAQVKATRADIERQLESTKADIERQFEVIQTRWVDDGDPFGVGADKDPLIGCPVDGGGKMVIQGNPPVVLGGMPAFTTVRGGEYLFRPGLQALRWLAAPR